MANAIPPIPTRTAVIDQRGMITPEWLALVREMRTRMGGSVGDSNTALADQATTIQDRVASLENEIGIGTGRAL